MKIACICLILALLVSVAWALRNLRERQLLQTDYNEALREIARLEVARSEDVDELNNIIDHLETELDRLATDNAVQAEMIRQLKGESDTPRQPRAVVPVPGTDVDDTVDALAAQIRKERESITALQLAADRMEWKWQNRPGAPEPRQRRVIRQQRRREILAHADQVNHLLERLHALSPETHQRLAYQDGPRYIAPLQTAQ